LTGAGGCARAWTIRGQAVDRLHGLYGLAVDGRGRVYFVDLDNPASLAFDGRRLLVTNLSLFRRVEANFKVLDVFAGERGLPLPRPR
jgi:hypothetical protein